MQGDSTLWVVLDCSKLTFPVIAATDVLPATQTEVREQPKCTDRLVVSPSRNVKPGLHSARGI
jgi:hypothetical protein